MVARWWNYCEPDEASTHIAVISAKQNTIVFNAAKAPYQTAFKIVLHWAIVLRMSEVPTISVRTGRGGDNLTRVISIIRRNL